MTTQFIAQTLVATLLSGSIVGIVLNWLVNRKVEKHRFTRDWKERSLSTIVGPVVMHLNRTDQVAQRYRSENYAKKDTSYFEAQIMRDSNDSVRALLLANGHLLPEDLRSHAHNLVAHFDVWLRRYDETMLRVDKDKPFNVGISEVSFPKDAARAFRDSFAMLRRELYGIEST